MKRPCVLAFDGVVESVGGWWAWGSDALLYELWRVEWWLRRLDSLLDEVWGVGAATGHRLAGESQ
jgi:hypothetical protein